jgi:uncharacterized protein (TIGR02118 family)
MIKYTVMYPFSAQGRFDHDYYRDTHLPLLANRLGSACKGYSAGKGLSSVLDGAPPIYEAMCDVFFESIEAFQTAFAPHAAELRGDIANFTDITPVRQFSEVR